MKITIILIVLTVLYVWSKEGAIINMRKEVDKYKEETEKELLDKINETEKELEKEIKITEEEIRNRKKDLEIYEIQLNAKIHSMTEDKNTLEAQINLLNTKRKRIENEIENYKEIGNKRKEIKRLKEEIEELNTEKDLSELGFYTKKYDFENSEFYKNKLNEIRDKEKDMVRNKMAILNHDGYKKNRSEINNYIKLTLKAFNSECDMLINNVNYNNIKRYEDKINKTYENINKILDLAEINKDYLNLKLEELYLKYEYECKKQEEKEEQLAIKERMREEAKILKEIEKAKGKIQKEELHFENAIQQLEDELENTKENDKKKKIQQKINAFKDKLEKLDEEKEDILKREENNRIGYVYVISNIGSFGENVFKIGMTRRLEPMDRIKELSGASVPFKFDVHAMIFSEDAPTLENNLHKYFADKRVNKINQRKEFFNVSIEEIEEVVTKEFGGTIEFTKLAQAEEYRQSISL